MTYKKNRLPQGVQDYLPEECYNKTLVEGALSDVYRKWGYNRIETAGFEYLSTFDAGVGLGANKIFKFTDYDGSLLALRPDPTLQIARMAADKGIDGVKRYYYVLSSYEFSGERVSAGRTREFAQTGVELLGAKGVEADAEIVALAIQSLSEAGVKDFLIEIGSVEFFKSAAAELGLESACAEAVRELINLKDAEGLTAYLVKAGMDNEGIEKLVGITRLFGDDSVLDKALEIGYGERAAAAVVRLQQLAALIKAMGLEQYCVFELGLVPELNYYSGLVIKGIAPSLGQPLLSGGRYDGLSAIFGAETAAVGFSVGIKRLLMALEKVGALSGMPCAEYVYYVADEAGEAVAYLEVTALRAKGVVAVRALADSEQEATRFCKANGIGTLNIFGGGGSQRRTV